MTRHHHHKEPKVDIPPLFGKESVDDYLDWEMKVKQLFECHQVCKKQKVSLATLNFQGVTMYRWMALVKDNQLHCYPQIQYWNELILILWKLHVPS